VANSPNRPTAKLANTPIANTRPTNLPNLFRSLADTLDQILLAEYAGSDSSRSWLGRAVESAQSFTAELALHLGHQAFAAGDSVSAVAAFQEAQSLRPYDHDLNAYIAEASAQRGDDRTAQLALGQAAKSKISPRAKLAAARTQAKLGNPDQAKTLGYELIAALNDKKDKLEIDGQTLTATAELLSSLNEHEAALKVWGLVIAHQPTATAYLTAATHALELGNAAQALELAWQAVGLNPQQAGPRQTLAAALNLNGLFADSLTEWQRAFELEPTPDLQLKVAQAALAAGQYESALETAEALLHNPAADALNNTGLPHIIAGRALTAQKQPERAVEYFNKATALAPNSIESWRAVAAYHRAQNDLQRALAALDAGRFLIDANTPEAADFFAELGDLRAELHHLTEAANAFEKAIQLKPTRISYLKRLGELYRLQNKLPDAIEMINRAAQTAAQDPALFHLLGQLLESAGRFPEALAAYRRAQTVGGTAIQLHRDLGRLAYQLHEIVIARPVLEKILVNREKFEPADLDSLVLLGALYEQAQEYESALAVYKHALSLDPLRSDLCVRLGVCCLELDQPETALAALKDAAERDLDNVSLQKIMGQAYAAAHLWLESVLAYDQATRLAPDDHALLHTLALAARQAGEPGRAADALQKAIALAPDNPAYRHALGELLIAGHQLADAKALYAESCQLLPNAFDLWLGFGQTQLMLNEVEAAVKSFEKATTLEPNNANALQALGEAHFLLANYPPAHAAFARAAELEPANPVPLRRAGDCMLALGRDAMALALWRKVLVTHPGDVNTRIRLGTTLAKLNQAAEALAELELATELAPNDAPLALEAARAAILVGKTDRALAHLERAAQAKSDLPEVWQLMSKVLQAKGQPTQALVAIRKTIRLEPHNGLAHATVAQLLTEDGNLAEALPAAELALKASPDDPNVLSTVAQVFVQAGRFGEAVALTTKVASLFPNDPNAHLAAARAAILAAESQVISTVATSTFVALERAAALGADEMEVKEWLGRAKVLANDLAEALPLLESASVTRPSADILRVLAGCYRRLNNIPQARQAALAALDRAPTALPTLIELGLIALAQNDKTGARAAFQRAISLDLHCAPAYQLLADTLLSMGERTEAINLYNQALTLEPNRAAWHHRLAELYEAARDTASALSHYQRAAALAREQNLPDNETANYLAAHARAQARDNDLGSALKEFESALSLRDDVATWWAQCAQLNLQLKNFERAFECFSRACELQPNDTPSFMGAARAALALGRGDEAEANAISVLRQNPDNYDALMVMGEIFESQSDLDNALLAFSRAAEHAPATAPTPALHAQARLLRSLHRPGEARTILQKLADLSPEDDTAWAALAETQIEAGQPTEAVPLYQRALQIAPRNIQHHIALGKLYRQLGQLDAALGQLQQAFELDPANVAALGEMAQVFEDRRQYSRAYEIYQQLIGLEPGNADHFFRAGLALKEMRDYLDALALFQQAVKLDPTNTEAQRQRATVAAFGILKGK
jgi:tetratricopeptide (TPR) repeat protein